MLSCGDEDNDNIFNNINVILPNSNLNKLKIELECDSIPYQSKQHLIVYPTPFSNKTLISMEVYENSKVKLEIVEISTNKKITPFNNNQILSAGYHLHELNKIKIADFKEGFLRANFFMSNKLINSIEFLYLNDRKLVFNEDNSINIKEYEVNNNEKTNIILDFKYLFGKTIDNISSNAKISHSYFVKDQISFTLTDSNNIELYQKKMTYNQLTQNNELIFTENDKITN